MIGTRDEVFARRVAEILDMFASPMANFGLFAPALSQRAWWNQPAEVFHRKRDQLDALMAEAITARRAGAPGDDILWMLLDLSDAELNDELKTLLAAGHETTATSIAWAADLLAHHPEIADRVRAGDRAYRAAAAKEVLRLRTILPISVARTLLEPTAGLPAGTVVLVHAGRLHQDPELFPEADYFAPSASWTAARVSGPPIPTCRSAVARTAASDRRSRPSSWRSPSRRCSSASSSSLSGRPRSRCGAGRRSSRPTAVRSGCGHADGLPGVRLAAGALAPGARQRAGIDRDPVAVALRGVRDGA